MASRKDFVIDHTHNSLLRVRAQFCSWTELFSGYVKDEVSAYKLIMTYEVATTSRFTIFKQTGGFKDAAGK